MENVAAFNTELSGLYDTKPPISKAKMGSITRAAMRAIKFYKHVVQSVEKFILKCKPEYKVPGLYVIDSIVRQSRHQYGPEKDVFAPRFARNIKETFRNLFSCSPEDKGRIIRVLNLWQKNCVFAPEVIQPLFDLADPNHPLYQMSQNAGPSGSISLADLSSTSNGLNASSAGQLDGNMSGVLLGGDDKLSSLPDLSNNNLKQLLNDPNVLRQLQSLQNYQKHMQQEENKHKHDMRLQEEAFEKHLQNVLKAQGSNNAGGDAVDFNAEVEFISEEQKIEVINLDGNDSRSPTPDRDRYKRRRSSRSRSRSRDRAGGGGGGAGGSGGGGSRRRRSRSRSRSRSPRSSNRRRTSRERERSNRDRERDREHERERRKKGLPEIRKELLSVCSTTLWVGHLSKLVYQEELSDTFGEYGDIVSIDQIVPRGCAFIVMNRRQDAYKAMQALKNHKLQGRAITISWAAGKGVKSKEWKDYWDLDLGVTYIPWHKLDENTDFDSLEEGGMFDEDSMPNWMKDKILRIKSLKEKTTETTLASANNNNVMFGIDTTQPPPAPPGPPAGPPPMMGMVPGQYQLAPPMNGPPRMLGGPMGMPLSGIPMPPNLVPGMPPPHPMMMPTGIMPPSFPPIPSGGNNAAINPAHIAMPPPSAAQFPPPPSANSVITGNTSMPPPPTGGMAGNNITNDDQMDIEMDEDEGPSNASVQNTQNAAQINFNQPPPMFAVGTGNVVAGNMNDNLGIGGNGEIFSRDRNRGGSRWGRGGMEDDLSEAVQRWRENGGAQNFNDGRNMNRIGGGPGMSIPPLDLNNPPQRPDFMNDFDNRGVGGSRGGPGLRGVNHNADFFSQNIQQQQQQQQQNRFNQPTSLLQMRIPPPSTFNARMSGPPMFMRGQGGPAGRQQGPGGFFNPRNPFNDNNRGAGGRGSSNRGRGGGARGGTASQGSNWSDDENDDGNNFKRRGGGGSVANRFRDHENPERHNNRERGGSRRGGNNARHDRDGGNGRGNFGGEYDSDGGERGNQNEDNTRPNNDRQSKNSQHDTEEDWDAELEEYDAKQAAETANKKEATDLSDNTEKETDNTSFGHDNNDDNDDGVAKQEAFEPQENTNNRGENFNDAVNDQTTDETFLKPETNTSNNYNAIAAAAAGVGSDGGNSEILKNSDVETNPIVSIENTTPLYDELPPPVAVASAPFQIQTQTQTTTTNDTNDIHLNNSNNNNNNNLTVMNDNDVKNNNNHNNDTNEQNAPQQVETTNEETNVVVNMPVDDIEAIPAAVTAAAATTTPPAVE